MAPSEPGVRCSLHERLMGRWESRALLVEARPSGLACRWADPGVMKRLLFKMRIVKVPYDSALAWSHRSSL
jgi:hypothetical protein